MREFIDTPHAIMDEYLDIADGTEKDEKKLIAKLHEFIDRDPEFYDPYVWLADYYSKCGAKVRARKLIQEAFDRAKARILDAMGRWPDRLDDGHLENRHITRALLNEAIMLWSTNHAGDALDILRNLLRMDPSPSGCICYYILAIRLGFTFETFENKFSRGEGYDPAVDEWFAQERVKFPEEWWQDIIET